MITVLSGGTGTPKLLQGLKEIVDPSDLTIIVNTLENDYFSGVYVSADIDTVLYTMSDMINDELWYGVKDDTFITHDRLEELGCGELLRIGDIDRATKIQKTQLMEMHGLRKACEIQAMNMGIESRIIPMSEEESEIKIITDIGELEFHDFLIKHQSEPEVLDVKFSNVNPSKGVVDAIVKEISGHKWYETSSGLYEITMNTIFNTEALLAERPNSIILDKWCFDLGSIKKLLEDGNRIFGIDMHQSGDGESSTSIYALAGWDSDAFKYANVQILDCECG